MEKYGGVWFDCDTVVLNSKAASYFSDDEHEVIFFGRPAKRNVRICNIFAVQGANLMRLWANEVRRKIIHFDPPLKAFWGYLGNSIIDPYVREHPEEILIHDMVPQMPELKVTGSGTKNYVKYYLQSKRHLIDIKSDMLLLHNNWTPARYKNATLDEIIHHDCTLSNILVEALELKR